MRRDEAIARLKSAEPEIRAFGVRNLYLFGSVARDEARADSDIDVFVDGACEDFYKLEKYMGVYHCLTNVFPNKEIGYTTREGLSKYIREDVERVAILVF